MTVGALLMVAPAFSQGGMGMGQGRATVTILAKHGGEPGVVSPQDVSIKLNGKPATITSWTPLRGANDRVQLVLLIDGSARTSLGLQTNEIKNFINSLPPNVEAVIAYMMDGSTVFTGPLSTDHAQVLSGLRLPQGSPGSNASPYFCLSDLAKQWPSEDRNARRVVVMVTDGVDNYERGFDPNDPYVQAAINDSARAGLIVYSIFWHDQGRILRGGYESSAGQNLLVELTDATGGMNFWNQAGNPISFQPFFDQLALYLRNQYEVRFTTTTLRGKSAVAAFKLKVAGSGLDVISPLQVFVERTGAAE
jgi:hypothetical protein